jgi:hypothetical protein
MPTTRADALRLAALVRSLELGRRSRPCSPRWRIRADVRAETVAKRRPNERRLIRWRR